MYQSGADVVFSVSGGSGVGVFEAARDSSTPAAKVWAVGVDSDQYQTAAPELRPFILTSMLKRIDLAVFDTISAYAKGEFRGRRSCGSAWPRAPSTSPAAAARSMTSAASCRPSKIRSSVGRSAFPPHPEGPAPRRSSSSRGSSSGFREWWPTPARTWPSGPASSTPSWARTARQVDADKHPGRFVAARRGDRPGRRPAGAVPVAGRRPRRRHRHGAPAAPPRRRAVGAGERHPRPGADAAGLPSTPVPPGSGWRPSSPPTGSTSTRRAASGASGTPNASGGAAPAALPGRAGAHPRRAHRRIVPRPGRGAPRPPRRAHRPGRLDRARLAPARRGAPHGRPDHRDAGRPHRGHA